MSDRPDWPLEHWIAVDDLGPTGRAVELLPDAATRAALAKSFDLLDLPVLEVRGHVWPADDGAFLEFTLKAHVVQRCVISLEPVASDIDEQVRLHYTPRAALHDEPETVEFDEEEDLPEPLTDGRIDLGAAVSEHLALALDPYPRRPDAVLPAAVEKDEKPNPFAVLERLKRNDN